VSLQFPLLLQVTNIYEIWNEHLATGRHLSAICCNFLHSTTTTIIIIIIINEELDKLIKHEDIINYIKSQRLSWFGHIQRMPDTRTVKKIFNWKPLTERSQGRPKYRWEDNVKQDICQMKIKNWIPCIQDRGKWKEDIEKAKTFN
jgi:hypothetical protein